MSLMVCKGCNRHIRRTETVCPFCHQAISVEAAAPERALPTTRLSRAALLAFAAASVGATACGGVIDEPNAQGAPTSPGTGGATGGASSFGGATSTGGVAGLGGLDNAGGDESTGGEVSVVIYGAPIGVEQDAGRDGGKTDSGASGSDASVPVGIYSAPPPPSVPHQSTFAFFVPPRNDDPEVVEGDEGDEI